MLLFSFSFYGRCVFCFYSNGIKIKSETSSKPLSSSEVATVCVRMAIRFAIFVNPSAPCHTAYMAAILASNAWAVHILEVAFSRLMCCSLVCNAMRNALLP